MIHAQRVRPEVAGPMTGSAEPGIHNHMRLMRSLRGAGGYGFRVRAFGALRND